MKGRKNRTSNCLVFTFLASLLCVLLISDSPCVWAAETMVAQVGSEEKAREAELMEEHREAEMRAKREAQEKARAKREEASRLAALDAEAKKQAKEEIAQAKSTKNARLSALDKDMPAEELARQKHIIESEYELQVAKIKMRLRHQQEARQLEQLRLPADTSPRLTVSEISFSGNILVTTAELLENMPLVYNVSDMPLEEADGSYLYDFSVISEIILEPGAAREVSTRNIQGLTQYVLSSYQQHNYAGIYVYVPADAVEAGKLRGEVLPIEVLEAPVTEVTVKSYDPNQSEVEEGYLRQSAVLEWSPVQPGQVADQKELDDFVNLLNLNPDRYVSAVVTKGAEPKSLAVAYDIYEANPWHYFAQVDNSGTRDRQWTPRVGLINTNLLGIDDTFIAIYQAPVESDWDENYSLYGSYDFPLMGPKLRLNIYGGYSQYDVNPESGTINFLGNGNFYGGILRYNLIQFDGWFFDIKGSVEHVRSKVTPSLFPGELGSDVKFWLWGYGMELYRSDDISDTSLTFDRVESWGGESDATEFGLARTGAKSDFTVYRTSAAHSRYLDPNEIQRFSSSFRWIGSNERLVPAQMTVFGGMYTVRGYDEYEVVADGGILASAQYEFDVIRYEESKQPGQLEEEETEATKDELEVKKFAPLVFFDYGRAKVKDPTDAEHGHTEMFSVGIGTLLELGENFSGAVYYGYPLRPTDDTRTGDGRVNVSFLLRW
ncbi:MAG: ShlB/FhaC/HecB family hemolysin secretion/activation protein [Planctomycetota bacterium]